LDDGHRYGTAHPSVVVIPSALAFGEKLNAPLSEVLRAIIIGYDIMLRISRSINPFHLKRGFHSTSTTGTLGSAAAASVIMGYNTSAMTHTLAIAGLFSSGLQEMLHSNPSVKTLQVGKSAQSGAAAAIFENLQMRGPISLLEGQHGWLKAMTDQFNEVDLLSDLGNRWEIMDTYTKLYPTCRHCHHAIDLAIEASKSGIRLVSIQSIKIKTYSVGIAEVGLIKVPRNLEEAMFSITYAVTIAIQNGFLKLEDMEKGLVNKQIVDFSSKIGIESDSEMDTKYPEERGCILEINLLSGNQIVLRTHLPKGEPSTGLTDFEYLQKFKTITSEYTDASFVENIFGSIKNCDPHKVSINDIISVLK
jgi:2-methylcitrate dehydratase PrpD